MSDQPARFTERSDVRLFVEMPKFPDKGNCVGLPADRIDALFFPTNGVIPRETKRLCDSCPIKDDCLDWAVASGASDGIWGGVFAVNIPERWKTVPGIDDTYEVSSKGNVRTWKAPGRGIFRAMEPMPMKVRTGGTSGALMVHLRVAGKQTDRSVARLILEAFVGPAPAGCKAAHLDGDVSNNDLTNLAWLPDSDVHSITRQANAAA